MNWKNYMLPFLISVLIHAGIILAVPNGSRIRVQYMRGDSAVPLTLMPSDHAVQRSRTRPPQAVEAANVDPPEQIRRKTSLTDTSTARIFYSQDADFTEIPASGPPAPRERKEPPKPPASETMPHTEPQEGPGEEPAIPERDEAALKEEPVREHCQAPEEHLEEAPEETAEAGRDAFDAPDTPGDVRQEGVESEVTGAVVPRPEYPPLARRRGHEGTVTVKVRVDQAGKATGAEIIESSGHSSLDAAALDAALNASFRPARRAGVAVAGDIRIRYRFRLKDRR